MHRNYANIMNTTSNFWGQGEHEDMVANELTNITELDKAELDARLRAVRDWDALTSLRADLERMYIGFRHRESLVVVCEMGASPSTGLVDVLYDDGVSYDGDVEFERLHDIIEVWG